MSDPTTTRPGDPVDPPGNTTPPPGKPAGDANGPFTFTQIYREELERLRPGVIDAPAVPYSATRDERHAALKRIFTQVHAKLGGNEGSPTEPLAALCLSGGGIRSATFNLGVLQALARCKVLDRFDHLSSVSGGSYIASWFEAWRHTAHTAPVAGPGAADVLTELAGKKPDNPLAPEPKPVDHLREYANYLTPRRGLFSVDLWTAVAVIVRNLILNWLVVLPVLAALVAFPQLCLLIVNGTDVLDPWYLGLVGLLLGFASHLATFLYREGQLRHTAARVQGAAAASERDAPGSAGGRRQVALMMVPLWLSALLMATGGIWSEHEWITRRTPPTKLWYATFGWMLVGPLLSWMVAVVWGAWNSGAAPGAKKDGWRDQKLGRSLGWEFLALLSSGTIAALVLLFGVIHTLLPWFQHHKPAFVALGVPAFLALHLLSHTLFVGGASRGERRSDARAPITEMDREWWGRYSGWVMVAAVAWLGVAGLVMMTPRVSMAAEAQFAKWLAGVGGVSGAVVWLLGKSAKTLSGRRDDAAGGSRAMELALVVAVPVFCAVLAMLLALGTLELGELVTGQEHLFESQAEPLTIFWFFVMILGLLAVGAFAARVVNVNRFSLQALYRNRLVRAYLGASNQNRAPDAFSGFDAADDVYLHELWNDAKGPSQRPMACINATLNLVSGSDKLAWQQRKAESFSMTPLYCGNFHDGYRHTTEYGGAGGMRLGSAVAISGAAANPNMGYHSSAGVTFLLTLFNARLGAWLGNTGKAGNDTYNLPGPRWALRPLLSELFGLTNAKSPYVNLSDGGHFENLGIYEMVLRRCRYILVSDAAQDADARFGDLGNAIRKIRIDFGIPIEFEKSIVISPRKDLPNALFCARARVCYSKVDDTAEDGELIYIKPAVYGRGKKTVPYDVRAYANTSEFFPHETTADQWFDESQFESYRALGVHAIEQITDECTPAGGGMKGFFESVRAYVDHEEQKQGKAAAADGDAPSGGASGPVPPG